MELISPALRLEFLDFCAGLYLRQIDDIFQMAEIPLGTIPPNHNISGERRTRVAAYYASIDWTSLADAQKFLKVVGLVISQSYISDTTKNFIRELCLKEGLIVEGHQVRLPETALHTILKSG